jgi:hypothetical protein
MKALFFLNGLFFFGSRYGSTGHCVKLSAQHPRLSSRLSWMCSRPESASHRVTLSAQHPRLSSRLPRVCSRPDAILCYSCQWSRPPPCGMGTVWCGSLNCVPLRMCVCTCTCTHEHTPLSSWVFWDRSTIGHSHFLSFVSMHRIHSKCVHKYFWL